MVGAAKVDVTPLHPVVLAGYGGRTSEFVGVDSRLWARAMVIGGEKPVAIVVLDNCGVPASVRARVAKRLAPHGISPERLVVAVTHTHNAPNLEDYAPVLWAGRTTPEQDARMKRYTTYAVEKMSEAILSAMANRELMHLEWGQGRAVFGGNRRVLRGEEWSGFGFQRDKPVDHSLPLLVARDEGGDVRALWANYACHCTTVGSRNHVGGDWAGYANEAMERDNPESVALMTIGCGADIGPQPSGNLEVAKRHGEAIGAEVQRLLGEQLTALAEEPRVSGSEARLPLGPAKPREHWEQLKAKGGFDGQLGIAMLGKIDAGEGVPTEVRYPVSSWRFGEELAMVFLPGEVVVDYAVRLNRELAWPRLWLTAWANDMPGYIPSRRVLKEGGYEADFSQVYYEQPGRYLPAVEDRVVEAVHKVVGESFLAPPNQPEAPFHELPSGAGLAFEELAKWAGQPKSVTEAPLFAMLAKLAPRAVPAVAAEAPEGGEVTSWHNFAGDFASRIFIRQGMKGEELSWISKVPPSGEGMRVLCFTGGTGWVSEPRTEGFMLAADGGDVLRFDLERRLARWSAEDQSIQMIYLPTWRSELDTGGFFFLLLSDSFSPNGGMVKFSVRSLGSGSKRWFAIDARQKIAENLPKQNAALQSGSRK